MIGRRIAAVFAVLMVSVLLVLPLGAQNKKTTVTFWAAAVTPERNAFFEDLFRKFNAQSSDIQVEYLGIPGDLNAYEQKLNIAIAAGQGPDITNDFQATSLNRGDYEALDSYLNTWADRTKLAPAPIAANRALDPKSGKLYALPYGIQVWNLWIRPDWFKEAGIPVPDTWDQFFAAAAKLTNKQKAHFGLSIRGGGGSANTLEFLMYSYSGITEFFRKDGSCTINDPKNIEFVQKYLGLYGVDTPEDDLVKGWTELAATFQSGKAAMVVHNLGSASSHEKAFGGDRNKFQAIPLPKSIQGYRVNPAFKPLGISMASASKHKEATWKVMAFYLSKEANSAYGKLYGEIPVNLSAAKDSWVTSLPYMKMGAELVADPSTKYYAVPSYLPAYTTIQTKIAEPLIQKVMIKKATVKELLDTWAHALEKEKRDFDASKK